MPRKAKPVCTMTANRTWKSNPVTTIAVSFGKISKITMRKLESPLPLLRRHSHVSRRERLGAKGPRPPTASDDEIIRVIPSQPEFSR